MNVIFSDAFVKSLHPQRVKQDVQRKIDRIVANPSPSESL